MEQLQFEFRDGTLKSGQPAALVGVVGSGNLEVLMENATLNGGCQVTVNTAARGFGQIWKAVLDDFFARHPLADVRVSINDMGATPAVVSLRLDQAVEEFIGG
jgi:malonate decarboxylase delta subunit